LFWPNLLVHRTLLFDEETTAYELFTKHPPILDMRLCETGLVNVALNVTFFSVDPTFAIPQSALLKDDVTFVPGVNLLSGHFCGGFLAKQEQATADQFAATPKALRPVVLQFTILPLLIAFATHIMIFWYLESIGDAFQFCFGSLCFVDSWMVISNQVLAHFPAGVFPTHERNLSIFSPLMKALSSFASQVVFQLHPDMTVTALNLAIEELRPLRVIECIDINLNLSLNVSFRPCSTVLQIRSVCNGGRRAKVDRLHPFDLGPASISFHRKSE
jgi:hypothetical protein